MKINHLESNKQSLLKTIKPETRTTIFSNGELSSVDVLSQIIKILNKPVSVDIMTWQLGVQNIAFFKNLNTRNVINRFRILLDVSYVDRCKKEYAKLKRSLGNCVWLTKNHSKIMLVDDGDSFYTVFSSANFNKNMRFEFFDVTESQKMHQFVKKHYDPFFLGDPIETERERAAVNAEFDLMFLNRNPDLDFEVFSL